MIRAGISGWTYPKWRNAFYPPGLPRKRELAFASRRFPTIEVNGSFYSLQTPRAYRSWARETPDGFVFAVKGGRFITHMKKLKDVDQALANFFASGVLALGKKLGPILWQFPPQLGFDRPRFEKFFASLPKNFSQAGKLARKHDAKIKGRAFLRTEVAGRIRYAVEIRHPSFLVPEFFSLLRKYRIAFVIADSAGRFPYREEVTADFVYVRLHGGSELYVSGYAPADIARWARRIRKWEGSGKKKRDVYVYFDNDAKVHAPYDAASLIAKLHSRRRTRRDLTGAAWKRRGSELEPGFIGSAPGV